MPKPNDTDCDLIDKRGKLTPYGANALRLNVWHSFCSRIGVWEAKRLLGGPLCPKIKPAKPRPAQPPQPRPTPWGRKIPMDRMAQAVHQKRVANGLGRDGLAKLLGISSRIVRQLETQQILRTYQRGAALRMAAWIDEEHLNWTWMQFDAHGADTSTAKPVTASAN